MYDSQAIRRFVGMDLGRESAPDATTLLKFRRLLEKHKLTASIFETINKHLASKGLMMRGGTVVDATIIAAPSSTKNRDRARDPEMHQTKKGNEWHFGMKAHIGVDAESGLTHTLVTTPANTADVTVADQLLHGEETLAFGDAGYRGVEKRAAAKQKRPHWRNMSTFFPEFDSLKAKGNPPLEPRGLEVEFFPKEEVLHEKVKILSLIHI